jgi:hypothetical protein
MLVDVIEARAVGGHVLWLQFEDGVEGQVDLSDLEFTGIFAPLKDPLFFAKVKVLSELGTLGWPNGAVFDPDVLYARLRRVGSIRNGAEG